MITAVEAAINEATIRVKTLAMGRNPMCKRKKIELKTLIFFFFYFGIAKSRNNSTKLKRWCEIFPTQKRHNCLTVLFRAERK